MNSNLPATNMHQFEPGSQKLLVSGQAAVQANLVTGTALNEYYVSRFNFQATKSDEMKLTKNMRVLVLQMENDGWWYGKDADTNGIEGWFPSNYVVKETLTQQNTMANKTTPTPKPPQPITTEIVCVVRALYAFNPSNPEELTFKQDEVLDVIEDPVNDPEWWVCRNRDNKTGLVPKNYVEVVPYNQSATSNREINYDPVTPQPINSSVPPMPQNGASGNNEEDWFFGKLTRANAEDLLKLKANTGEFLVRNSETSKGDFSISMKMENRVRHFKVTVTDGAFKIGQKKFDSMKLLLEHYKQSPIFTNEQGKAFLTIPVIR